MAEDVLEMVSDCLSISGPRLARPSKSTTSSTKESMGGTFRDSCDAILVKIGAKRARFFKHVEMSSQQGPGAMTLPPSKSLWRRSASPSHSKWISAIFNFLVEGFLGIVRSEMLKGNWAKIGWKRWIGIDRTCDFPFMNFLNFSWYFKSSLRLTQELWSRTLSFGLRRKTIAAFARVVGKKSLALWLRRVMKNTLGMTSFIDHKKTIWIDWLKVSRSDSTNYFFEHPNCSLFSITYYFISIFLYVRTQTSPNCPVSQVPGWASAWFFGQ